MPDYRRRATRAATSVRLDVNGMMEEAVGRAGVTREEVDALQPRLIEITRTLKSQRQAGELGFYELPHQRGPLAEVKALAAQVREECDTLVVLGIGGSALGTKTLLGALVNPPPAGEHRRVIVADTIDPWSFGRLLDGLDLRRTIFNVISKSGESVETMAQFLIVRDLLLRELGAVDYATRVVITTDADSGALRQVVHDEGFRSLPIAAGVSGRFSVLTSVGLFPAAVAGVRIEEVLAGAAWMEERCRDADVWRNPGHLLGTLLYLADTRHQQHIVVLMPYSDRLRSLGDWFAQLWAESLGKSATLEGARASVGPTPLPALGSADQHALLQLFVDGPSDKVVIMLRVEDHGRELPVASAYADLGSIGYLGGTGLGMLLNLEQRATELALVKRQRPVITLHVPQINAFALGQLLFLFEVAVVFAAALYRVNPFDQPAVEESKRLTYGQVGRKGFEEQRGEVEEWIGRKRGEYIL